MELSKRKVFGEMRNHSFVDYPSKISAVIYISECNLLCSYCHNHGLITESGSYNLEEILFMIEVEHSRGFIDAVVVSGGEPSLQHDIVYRLIVGIRKMSPYILIKIDTNGTNPEFIKRCIELDVDRISMDYKTLCYLKMFQIQSKLILDSLDILSEFKNHEIRITMAPDYISETNIPVMLMVLATHNIKNVSIQKYHTKNAFIPTEENYTDEELMLFKSLADSMGFKTTLRL